jgi:hypothetical protein
MSQFMHKFGEFWGAWGPWISIGLIPTIIAGLSISPKTRPSAGTVEKIWNVFKQFLSALSLLTFKDQPGTFQAPLKLGKLRRKKVKESGETKSGGGTDPGCAAGILLLLVLTVTPILPGCCALTGSCKEGDTAGQIATGVIDCAKEAIKSQAAHLLPTIMAILVGGAPNWQAQLDSLKAMGIDAGACALATASTQLLALSVPDPNEGMTAGPEKLKARAKAKSDAQKAEDYLKANKLKTINVPQ